MEIVYLLLGCGPALTVSFLKVLQIFDHHFLHIAQSSGTVVSAEKKDDKRIDEGRESNEQLQQRGSKDLEMLRLFLADPNIDITKRNKVTFLLTMLDIIPFLVHLDNLATCRTERQQSTSPLSGQMRKVSPCSWLIPG